MSSYLLRPRGIILWVGILIVGALTMTGCVPQRQPNTVTLPELVWEDGIAPDSPLDNDPLVKFARTATAAEAYAWNHGNFAFHQLIDSYTPDTIEQMYESYIEQISPGRSYVYPGPPPWQPLGITKNKDGTRTLLICSNDDKWYHRADDPNDTGTFDRTKTTTGQIRIEIVGKGSYRVVGLGVYGSRIPDPFGNGQPCDGSRIRVGRYAAQPPFPKLPVTKAKFPPITLKSDER